MDVNTELLEYMYQNIEMGLYSLKQLINTINGTENKIKKLISDELHEYETYQKEVEKLIKKRKVDTKGNSIFAKMGASMGIKMDMMKDNSDSSIAHMLTEGFTMGIVDISSKIKNYKDTADKNIIKLAKKYLSFQQEEVEKLKEYL